ncbi:MAG: NAD(P)/FAD-dependent oxidoreductase [Aminipila sp.]
MYRISQVKLDLHEDKSNIPKRILEKIKKENISIVEHKIIKESIDARDKNDIKKVYTVDFLVDGDISKEVKRLKLTTVNEQKYDFNICGIEKIQNRPVIVGFGPCGMFAALILSELGFKPLIIERGKSIEDRVIDVEKFWQQGILDEESNVQFGEGGAGTFSDGKLTTQIKDFRISKVLEVLVEAGADPEILYKQKPHIGTDILRNVVINIRNKVIENGGEILYSSKLTNIEIQNDSVCAIQINSKEWIKTENVVLAIGHSARDTFKMLNDLGINMIQKPFSMGVRIEHLQELVDKSQYGRTYEQLGAAEYKLAHRCENGRGVYTFCMCPGGEVIVASSQKEKVTTNGMSYHSRAGKYANSALLVDIKTEDFGSDDVLAGVKFQEKYEQLAFENGGRNYNAPKSTWGEFVSDSEKGRLVKDSLPKFVVESILEAMPFLGRKLKGFYSPSAILTAVEARSSSPVRILRDLDMESSFKGIYPGGEGAGYAGGITSAAVDGIKIAEKIATKYKP